MAITGLMALLRGLKVPGLDQLKQAGVDALIGALKAAVGAQKEKLLAKALKRLESDGVTAALAAGTGTWTDKDGVVMNPRQRFFHEALYALPRTITGGVVSDVFRDDHFAAYGLTEADTLLSGVTDGKAALEIVFRRAFEQAT